MDDTDLEPDPNPPPRAPIGYRAPRDDQAARLTALMSAYSLRDQKGQLLAGLTLGFIALPGALCSGMVGDSVLGIGGLFYLALAIAAVIYGPTRGYGVGLLIALAIVGLLLGTCFVMVGGFRG